jgi:putative transposase
LIAVTAGLKGLSEALAAVYPATTLQTCIVHLLRQSLDFANWKERKPMAAALEAFAAGPRGQRFPMIVKSWRQARAYVIPMFTFPQPAAQDHQNAGALPDR